MNEVLAWTTPRTDAEANKSKGDYYYEDTVPADFARQLERELDASKRELENSYALGNGLERDLIKAKVEVSHYMKRALDAENELRTSPVIGECEECGHSIVTPLKRL